MMYNNKLVVAVKSNGKVLREQGENVFIPFGCEYSILIKNLNTVRALVNISVDGVDLGDGTEFVVHPNSDFNIERFIKNGNFSEGNRLKFIERTAGIEQHRGVGMEDGLIRVEFKFEKLPVVRHFYGGPTIYHDHWHYSDHTFGPGDLIGSSENLVSKSFTSNTTTRGMSNDAAEIYSVANASANVPANDVGITVAGSVSDQQFKEASWFATEDESHVVILKMLGLTDDNRRVEAPVYVKMKPKCTTCGRTNKAGAKFCTECGTSLTIV